MSAITARPLTAVPLTARPLTAYALGVSTSGGADPLVWHAATYDPTTFELQAQRVGTGTPTFTSSAMLLPDWEGKYVTVAANSAPWHGARQVKNQVVSTVASTGSVTITEEGAIGPDGASAQKAVFASAATSARVNYLPAPDTTPGYTSVLSVWLKGAVGGEQIKMWNGWTVPSSYVTLTTEWQRFHATKTETFPRNFSLLLYANTGTPTIYISCPQAEVTDGQSNQNPGEYVATTSAGATKYFANQNGNTVSSNVVTEATGTVLSTLPSLYGAPAYTNSLTYSNDLTNAAWTKTNCTAALDAIGITGAPSTASTLTATAANATCIHSAVTAASGTHTTNWRIKRKTGTGTIDLTVDNGTTWQDVTSLIDSTDFNECMESLTVTNPQIGIRIVTSGDAVYVGNSSCNLTKTEAEVRGSAPIVTAASTVTTSTVASAYDIANHSDTRGAYYLEATPFVAYTELTTDDASILYARAVSNTVNGFITTRNAALNRFGTNDNEYARSEVSYSFSAGDQLQIGIAYDAVEDKRIVVADGVDGTVTTHSGTFLTTAEQPLRLGYDGSISGFGKVLLIRNMRRYDLPYAAAKAKLTELMQ